MLHFFLISLLLFNYTTAQRVATVHEVQPTLNDVVHTVWLNGPTYSTKIGGNWPRFSPAASKSGARCATKDDRFTGYNEGGQYCEAAASDLDDNAHLLLHSGHLGIVVDADLSGPASNLFPKIGSTKNVPLTSSSTQMYEAVQATTTSISLTKTCSGVSEQFVLGTTQSKFAQLGLVRQGHTVTQLTISALKFQHPTTGAIFGSCSSFTATIDPNPTASDNGSPNCNGSPAWPCPTAYPDCVGFVQGSSWGRCYDVCTSANPQLWSELTMWGDSISIRLAWDSAFEIPLGCTGSIQMSITAGGSEGTALATQMAALTPGASGAAGAGEINLFFEASKTDGAMTSVTNLMSNSGTAVVVTSSMATVLARSKTRDVIVEVPGSTPKCAYNMNCKDLPLLLYGIEASNAHATEEGSLRLSFSRNFHTGENGFSQSQPSAEITGLSAQLFSDDGKPTGLPCHISKNWHAGNNAAYWAGFDGTWWTVNCFLRVPPSSKISLSLAINYEKYGQVSAFSHAQLSIVGYSDKWLWEQAAIGTGGENICFDPLGTHTRAMITDVRPKLFDGKWKENVGGGDFTLMFDQHGKMQYLKSMDPLIHSNGPCLSNASYDSVTLDDSIRSHVEVSGGRTDDIVRVFFKLKLHVLKDVTFSRLSFFQFGSETYNYRALFDEFVVGSVGGAANTHTKATHARTCTGSTSRNNDKLYDTPSTVFREKMSGTAPFYISYGSNSDTATMASSNGMVVGDRGLVVNRYNAKLNGIESSQPTYSILCDKIEIGTPANVLTLKKNDYVEMDFEILVLPRLGEEFTAALTNTGNSISLQKIASLTSQWERVKAFALGSTLSLKTLLPGRAVSNVLGSRSRIESHYPIRVCATGTHGGTLSRSEGDTGVLFEVSGSALGYVPIVICGLTKHDIPSRTQGLWMRSSTTSSFSLLNQSTVTTGDNDFWQVNFDRKTRLYEVVFNVEIFNEDGGTTIFGFGSRPDLWPATPVQCDSVTSSSTPSIQELCKSQGNNGLIEQASTTFCASASVGCTAVADAGTCCKKTDPETDPETNKPKEIPSGSSSNTTGNADFSGVGGRPVVLLPLLTVGLVGLSLYM